MSDVRRCVGHTLSDFDGRLLSVDPLFCELLHMRFGDLIGRHILDLTHPLDREDTEVAMRRIRDEGRPLQIEKRYVQTGGTVVWAEVHAMVASSSCGGKHIFGEMFLIEPKPLLALERERSAAVHDALSRHANATIFFPSIGGYKPFTSLVQRRGPGA